MTPGQTREIKGLLHLKPCTKPGQSQDKNPDRWIDGTRLRRKRCGRAGEEWNVLPPASGFGNVTRKHFDGCSFSEFPPRQPRRKVATLRRQKHCGGQASLQT